MKWYAALPILLLTGCAPAVDVNALATRAIETFQAAPVASATPIPATDTPSATATIEAPSDLDRYLTNVRVLSQDSFDTRGDTLDYALPDMQRVDGWLRMEGHNWNGAAWSAARYPEGTAFVFDFKQETSENVSPADFWFAPFVEIGTWQAEDYRRFGIFLERIPEADIWIGPSRGSVAGRSLTGDLGIEPHILYRMLMAVGPEADFLSVIWDPDNPEVTRTLRLPMGAEWSGQDWLFGLSGNKGILLVDDFTIASFDNYQ